VSKLYQIALTCISGIGHVTARNLLSHCGSAEGVFNNKKSHLLNIPGVGNKTADLIVNHSAFKRAEQELEFIEKYKIQSFFVLDKEYPQRLRNCADAPIMLYFKGAADFNPQKVISVVGTRNASEYGREICRIMMADLKVHDPLVVSGLAHGIDSMAHKGVLGHGLDRIYPAVNRSLAEKMISCGGLLTEFMSGTNPDRENFPKRNRIIAGMADATIVVEANIKGGALITADIANSYNRDVFAFPGRVHDEFSSGCNFLIKTNRANLISGVADLEYLLGWKEVQASKNKPQMSLALDLSADERKITDLLTAKGLISIDELSILSNLSQSKMSITLLGLEMQGIVISLPGKMYKIA
jgi:DNA processing protein